MSGAGSVYGVVTVSPPAGFDLIFDGVQITEQLGRPFEILLDVSSGTAKPDLVALLGSSVTLTVRGSDQRADTVTKRYFNGILVRVVYGGLSGGAYHYHLELRPWIWLLSRVQDCHIFNKADQTAWSIITQIFRDAGFSDFSDKRQNQSGETVLEYCVQYRETSFDFVTRLMEQFGLYYYFEHADGKHTMVMADDTNSHTALPDAIPYQAQMTEVRVVQDHIWQFSADLRLQSGAFTYRDYNFTTPTADLTAKSIKAGAHPHATAEFYDYPGPYDTAGNGQKLADIRMQDLTARRETLSGHTNARGIRTGTKFKLSQFQDKSMNREYLVIAATYKIGIGESKSTQQGELTDSYEATFQAIPGDTPFRLPNWTPRPMIRGPQTAKVVGKPGDEITTDLYGRVKVKFYWDRSDAQDDTASCWIRVAQIWAGSSWGAMFIPRVGQEVVVEFLEGNPDRPLITGRVYNANVKVPYTLPDEKTKSTIKSNSSQGGGGFNELRFEDKKGSEEIFLQAQKDYNKVVLNSETVKVTQDSTTTVDKGDRAMTVSKGKHSTTVSAGNCELTVSQGDHTMTITAGNSIISAGQSITLKVGGNSIKIDTSGITITAAKISLQASGTMSVQAGGPLTVAGATVAIN